jgi:hypothetical protein
MRIMKPQFIVDVESFQLVQADVGIGRIVELDSADAGLLAKHVDGHPDTIYLASSGVQVSGNVGLFVAGTRQVAIEWVRQEKRPKLNEPEINTYRYVFGLTNDGRCVGYDVTEPFASPNSGQVADHWTTFNDVIERHFPTTASQPHPVAKP